MVLKYARFMHHSICRECFCFICNLISYCKEIEPMNSMQGVTYMPTAPIFEHSGTDEPSDRSDRNESPEETDSSFFHPSYIQACPVHDRHRCLRQTREFRQPRELHRINAVSQSPARIRLFFTK